MDWRLCQVPELHLVDNYTDVRTNNGVSPGAAIFSGWDQDRKIYMINTIIWGGKAYRGGAERTDLDRGDDLNIELDWGPTTNLLGTITTSSILTRPPGPMTTLTIFLLSLRMPTMMTFRLMTPLPSSGWVLPTGLKRV
jgi:hypothetical protein